MFFGVSAAFSSCSPRFVGVGLAPPAGTGRTHS